jgi:hypothetical protein
MGGDPPIPPPLAPIASSHAETVLPAVPARAAPRPRRTGIAAVAIGGSLLLGAATVWRFRSHASAASSCAEIRAAHPDAGDGDYEIQAGPIQAGPAAGALVRVYCRDMARAPREYLTLLRTRATGAGDANCSHYGASPNSPPGGQTTCFTRVRLIPSALAVDVGDTTFAIKDGTEVRFGDNRQDAVPYATAEDCVSDRSHTGTANIDLTGTPFAVERDQFVLSGWRPAGTATLRAFDQVVDLVGGGHCGGMGLALAAGGRAPLKLAWARTASPVPAAPEGR